MKLIINYGYIIVEAVKNLSIPRNMLAKWYKVYWVKEQDAFPARGHQFPEAEEISLLREENRKLKIIISRM